MTNPEEHEDALLSGRPSSNKALRKFVARFALKPSATELKRIAEHAQSEACTVIETAAAPLPLRGLLERRCIIRALDIVYSERIRLAVIQGGGLIRVVDDLLSRDLQRPHTWPAIDSHLQLADPGHWQVTSPEDMNATEQERIVYLRIAALVKFMDACESNALKEPSDCKAETTGVFLRWLCEASAREETKRKDADAAKRALN